MKIFRSLFPAFLILGSLSLIHLLLFRQFAPTWDFPHHLLIGEIWLGIKSVPAGLTSVPYGIVTDVVPLLVANFLPGDWKPESYSLFSVIIGCTGIFFFYLLTRKYLGEVKSIFCCVLITLMPRFVGHLHTNTKDIASASLFVISLYFFLKGLNEARIRWFFLTIFALSLGVLAKLTALGLIPIYLFAIGIEIFLFRRRQMLPFLILFLPLIFIVPIGLYALLWPWRIMELSTGFRMISGDFTLFPPVPFHYALQQFVGTTPLPILLLAFIGVISVLKDKMTEKNRPVLVCIFWLLYTVLKYPLLRFPIIDDVRYFIDIYFPLSFFAVLGLEKLFKRRFLFGSILVAAVLLFLNIAYHPYEINYYNALGKSNDADFWAASYREVFSYINSETPKGKVVSARLAPELAGYYIRDDLKPLLNSKPPEESDVVVLLNRKSFFKIFDMERFYGSRKPAKEITMRNGTVLSYIYFKR